MAPTPAPQPYTQRDVVSASEEIVKKVTSGDATIAVNLFYTAYVRAVTKDDKDYAPNEEDIGLAKRDPRFRDLTRTLKAEATSIGKYTGATKKLAQRLFAVTLGERLRDNLEGVLARELFSPVDEA